jgi:hypothetical protein
MKSLSAKNINDVIFDDRAVLGLRGHEKIAIIVRI